jgi:hypothetical protein
MRLKTTPLAGFAALALLASAPLANAVILDFTGDYAPSNWASTTPGSSSFTFSGTGPNMLTAVTDNSGSFNPSSGTLSITVPQTGTIQFTANSSTSDGEGWGSLPTPFDSLGYSLNAGSPVILSGTSGNGNVGPVSGNVSVTAGDVFRFFANSSDSFGGAATMVVTSFSFTPVPEPATYAVMAGAGLLGFAVWRRRQQAR